MDVLIKSPTAKITTLNIGKTRENGEIRAAVGRATFAR